MAKPFDVTTKVLIETRPADWLTLLGHPGLDAEAVDADLSAVSSEADKVLRVRAPNPWLIHLEMQASYDATLVERTLQYSVLIRRRHGLPVESALLLLRPEADGPDITGRFELYLPDGTRYLEFTYRVIRVWQLSAEDILQTGLATLPLAPLAAVTRESLPEVIRRMQARIVQEAMPSQSALLWTATYLLLGLRYPGAFAEQLLRGVRDMRESTTYQAILQEGRTEGLQAGRTEGLQAGLEQGREAELREILIRLGSKRFGPPDAAVQAAIEALTGRATLERLADRLLDVENWQELLQPAP